MAIVQEIISFTNVSTLAALQNTSLETQFHATAAAGKMYFSFICLFRLVVLAADGDVGKLCLCDYY